MLNRQSGERRLLDVPFGGLLIVPAHAEKSLLVKGLGQKLQTCRQTSHKTAGQGQTANTADIGGAGVNIGQIHHQRIAELLSQFESNAGRRRRYQTINLFEYFLKLLGDQYPQFLRFEIILIIISGRQSESAQNNPALNFIAKSLGL